MFASITPIGREKSQEGFLCSSCAFFSQHHISMTIGEEAWFYEFSTWHTYQLVFGGASEREACVVDLCPTTLKDQPLSVHPYILQLTEICDWARVPWRRTIFHEGLNLKLIRVCCIHLHRGNVRHIGRRISSWLHLRQLLAHGLESEFVVYSNPYYGNRRELHGRHRPPN